MTLETQIKNLELRLAMAISHVTQAAADLDAIRLKAGLPPAEPMFHLAKPPAEAGWLGDPGREEWLSRQRAKCPAPPAAPEASIRSTQRQHESRSYNLSVRRLSQIGQRSNDPAAVGKFAFATRTSRVIPAVVTLG